MIESGHVGEIVARYALGTDAVLSGPAVRGEQGEVWRLTTSLGDWALKRLFRPLTEADVGEEADYEDAVHAAGVPTPLIVRTVDGDILASAAGKQVRVYDWVELLEPDPLLDPRAVGAVVARIHQVPFSGHNPVDPWYTDPVGARRWGELAAASTEAGAPFATELAAIHHELIATEALLESPSDLQTCHRDLWADNLRGTPNQELSVIDWHDCGLADPSQELALVLYEFASGDAERARLLYRAYLDAGGPGRIDRPGNFSMAIAQLGHITARACERWLDPSTTEAGRGRSASLCREFMARPLTRPVIEEFLAALTGP